MGQYVFVFASGPDSETCYVGDENIISEAKIYKSFHAGRYVPRLTDLSFSLSLFHASIRFVVAQVTCLLLTVIYSFAVSSFTRAQRRRKTTPSIHLFIIINGKCVYHFRQIVESNSDIQNASHAAQRIGRAPPHPGHGHLLLLAVRQPDRDGRARARAVDHRRCSRCWPRRGRR
ncbi:hypothetical protein B0H66DRAFT_616594 [Apodospora peruviana]|uniref:Uncharacterized protein n=1 Tax=Apodospora peruviana TaxID=516989 RepID=A0AAE0IJ39_9PEZI|nr:hypothetical protein B0H66DRAFT_616594 [Apodospora peruviana]